MRARVPQDARGSSRFISDVSWQRIKNSLHACAAGRQDSVATNERYLSALNDSIIIADANMAILLQGGAKMQTRSISPAGDLLAHRAKQEHLLLPDI